MLRSLWKADANIIFADDTISLGRHVLCGIQDIKCSRHQVEATFNKATQKLLVKAVGSKSAFVNDTELTRGCTHIMNPGDKLELLKGRYSYVFELPKEANRNAEQQEVDSTRSLDNSKLSGAIGTNNCIPNANDGAVPPTETDCSSSQSSGTWKTIEDKVHFYTSPGVVHRTKIAAFDLDGTLICTKSGYVFPKNEDDWQILFPEIPKKLQDFQKKQDYKIVIFTNQKGIQTGKSKIEKIVQCLGISAQVFVSTGDGTFRKPMPGMWDLFVDCGNGGLKPEFKDSFFVGDAAGRLPLSGAPKKAKKDHSCADRLFALNVGLKFQTPLEFFLGKKSVEFSMPTFDPRVLVNGNPRALLEPSDTPLTLNEPELIVMVGFPASGKSSFVSQYLLPKGYSSVNQDTLKSWQKCVLKAQDILRSGKSVVVDNTNPDRESRLRYIEVAKKVGVKCRCFLMNVTFEHALHNNKFRSLIGTDKAHEQVNVMILNSYKNKFEEPTISEGFDAVVRVNFIPYFKTSKDKTLYGLFLLER